MPTDPEMVKIIDFGNYIYTFMTDKLDVLGSCNQGANSFVARVCKVYNYYTAIELIIFAC